MSMSHKAFAFNWAGFERELAPLLLSALTQNKTEALIEFANAQRESLVDPYTGSPLEDDWRENLEVGDVQEIGDFVLTKYYDPSADFGLGSEWQTLEAKLSPSGKQALLGKPFGRPDRYFDPGRMGSYFQDEATVTKSLDELRKAPESAALTEFVNLLAQSATQKKGVYVTF
jgi:hypothetical protein